MGTKTKWDGFLEIQDYINENAGSSSANCKKEVITLRNKWKAEKYIVVGLSQGNKSMIKSGLKIGDEVIIEGYSEIIGGSLLEHKKLS